MRIKLFLIPVLAILFLFFARNAHQVWQQRQAIQPAPPPSISSTGSAGAATAMRKKPNAVSPLDRTAIELNLFSADRAEYVPPPPKAIEEVKKELKLPGRKITLFGVVMMQNYRKALIRDPYTKPGQPPHRWVKAGDAIGDYTVRVIQNQGIIVASAGERYKVPLYEIGKKRSGPVAGKSNTPTVVRSSVEVGKKTMTRDKKKTKTELSPEEEYVKTPFGMIKRRKK